TDTGDAGHLREIGAIEPNRDSIGELCGAGTTGTTVNQRQMIPGFHVMCSFSRTDFSAVPGCSGFEIAAPDSRPRATVSNSVMPADSCAASISIMLAWNSQAISVAIATDSDAIALLCRRGNMRDKRGGSRPWNDGRLIAGRP